MVTKLVIMASGRGTDFQSIADHVSLGVLKNIIISGVICNHEGAQVIERAARAGVPSIVVEGISGQRFETKQERERQRGIFDNHCIESIRKSGADLVILAGFDQILSSSFVDSFRLRILNIHPAYDLNRFGGRNMVGRKVHELVLKSGVKYSGCAIHFVTNDVDGGPILLKSRVEISIKETPDSLERKILQQEHLAYPEAIQLVSDGRVRFDEEGKRCYVDRFSMNWDVDWYSRQQQYLISHRGEV
jgi:phosphoribosylglycinamide formyltransferase-1